MIPVFLFRVLNWKVQYLWVPDEAIFLNADILALPPSQVFKKYPASHS